MNPNHESHTRNDMSICHAMEGEKMVIIIIKGIAVCTLKASLFVILILRLRTLNKNNACNVQLWLKRSFQYGIACQFNNCWVVQYQYFAWIDIWDDYNIFQ